MQSRLRCDTVLWGSPKAKHSRDNDDMTCCQSYARCRVKGNVQPSEILENKEVSVIDGVYLYDGQREITDIFGTRKSKIVIPHSSTDKTNYDDFGAYLCTFKEHRKDGSIYYRHFLDDVDPDGPAGQMRFDNNDEIAALNEEFVPELTQKKVLALFRNVKVDGKTSLAMVTLRHGKWTETSAYLLPEVTDDGQPGVTQLARKESKGKTIEGPESKHLYKVPGTQQYLDIFNGQVSFDTLNHCARTNTICRRMVYVLDNDVITYKAALSDDSKRWYIGVDGEAVVLKKEPVLFQMTTTGRSTYHFQFQGKYLGYKLKGYRVSREVKVQLFKYGFEQYTPESKYEEYPACERENHCLNN